MFAASAVCFLWDTKSDLPTAQALVCGLLLPEDEHYEYDFVLLRIFYEGVTCKIKSWDIIY